MEFNNKKLEKTSKFVNIIISTVLCGFLILLSGKVIGDVDDWRNYPQLESYENQAVVAKNDSLIHELSNTIEIENSKITTINSAKRMAQDNYSNEKQSFDTWLKARKVIGSPTEDNEITKRAKALDDLRAIEQDWSNEANSIDQNIQNYYSEINKIEDQKYADVAVAQKLRNVDIKAYEIKVFLIRLVIVLPILLLGIFFLVKFRKHKYWPLFLGFILFSFYAFFIGLVPYLPSYGGYIRYTVGIVLCVLLGVFTINKIRAFIDNKKKELKVSTKERAKNVQTATAEKALESNMCPSCGKGFVVVGWDQTSDAKKKPMKSVLITNYCRFCGLQLFKNCNGCDTKNFAHLPFCSNCGDNIIEG
jgi:hypothetical protein